MLTCHTCMKRCLQTIIGESVQFTPSLRASLTPTSRRSSRRSYASQTDTQSRPWTLPHRSNREEPTSTGGSSYRSDSKFDRRPLSREEWLASRGVRPHSKLYNRKPNFDSDFSMGKHLTYLKDPLKLAEFIRTTLRNDDFETAEKVVRAASKSIQCTVSWNHLVDWQLSKGRMNAAIKTYNEMKKRAQVPDAHTYTIIFRGCAEHKDSTQALTKVLAIYHSMLTEKSPIKPNTIHMNAVLKMCAKAQNMDAMFGVADQMPPKGIRAPNNLTFTTIINALRLHSVGDLRGALTPMQKRNNQQKAILNARHIWADIIKRWRQGDIWIDEELVCAMGRLLVVGTERDIDDILSLVEQTMNIPRQIPRKGTPGRSSIEPSCQGRVQSDEDSNIEFQDPERLPADGEVDLALVDQFQSIKPPAAPEGSSAYAQPGQNTLSLVLLALLELRLKDTATKYWDIFTKDLGVKPDAENHNAYLRLLRVARASTETVRVLLKMPQSDMETKTFRIAMATCMRDKNNPHAFANSGKILDLMQGALKEPDVKALEAYLEVAVTSPAYFSKDTLNGRSDQANYAQGAQITRALDRLGPSFLNLKSVLSFGDSSRPNLPPHKRAEFVASVLQLTQRMISAYDLVMNKGMAPRERYLSLTKHRSKLAAFVTRHKHLRDGSTPFGKSPQNFELPARFKNRLFDPEIQRRMADAKKSKETWEAFLSDLQASVSSKHGKIDRDAWEMHANTSRTAAAEALAEEERRVAEAATQGVFAMEDERDPTKDFATSHVRVRY